MKKITLLLLILRAIQGAGQPAVTVLVPPAGLVDKQQLWNILVTNTGTSVNSLRIQILLTDATSGEPVFTATTGLIDVSPGTKQLSGTTIGTVQYNILSTQYRIGPEPTGLLPAGDFAICYNFLYNTEKSVLQDCQQLHIEPLTPLLLNTPVNNSEVAERYPLFSWLPVLSSTVFNKVAYTMRMVEVYSGQTPVDAILKNVPVFTSGVVGSTNLVYGSTAPVLESSRQYAWQVIALDHSAALTKSEIWSFTTSDKPIQALPKSDASFIKLSKAGADMGRTVFFGALSFEYVNETTDSVWHVQLFDLSASHKRALRIATLDTMQMAQGENLVRIPVDQVRGLKKDHMYLLQLTNSRQEKWQLHFEYRKEDE